MSCKMLYTCDHCGKELDSMHDYTDANIEAIWRDFHCDLCAECFKELSDIIEKFLQKESEEK